MTSVTRVKLSLTIDDEIADAVREMAGAGGTSAFVNDELAKAVWRQRSRCFLADLDEKLGPVGPETDRWADDQLAMAMGALPAE